MCARREGGGGGGHANIAIVAGQCPVYSVVAGRARADNAGASFFRESNVVRPGPAGASPAEGRGGR